MNYENKNIIFFDGYCSLCNGFIDFIIRRDKKHFFHISSLQGKAAQIVLSEADINQLSTVILLNAQGKKFYKSKAVFEILLALGGLHRALVVFKILPRFVTDFIYDVVAKNRYRIFGKVQSCRVPTAEERTYFLD